MRALLKAILKGSGTPVLQTLARREETILSAGNIWTSAHARRIAWRERGLMQGAVLCSDAASPEAVVDFVACAIGGFVYFPVGPVRLRALRQNLALRPLANRAGIAFADKSGGWEHHPHLLPCLLAGLEAHEGAMLALEPATSSPGEELIILTASVIETWLAAETARLVTLQGGTRLTYGAPHHGRGFLADLLLAVYSRQTIHIRDGEAAGERAVLAEILALDIDDLVLRPAMLPGLGREAERLDERARARLQQVRLHAGGQKPTAQQAAIAARLFGRVLVEGLPQAGSTSAASPGLAGRRGDDACAVPIAP